MRSTILELPRYQKRLLSIFVDVCILWLSIFLAYKVRLAGLPGQTFVEGFVFMLVLAPVTAIPFYIRLGLYRAILRYMDPHVSMTIFRACTLGALGLTFAVTFSGVFVPRSVLVLFWLFSLVMTTASRYAARYWLQGIRFKELLISPVKNSVSQQRLKAGIPVVIYGAGNTGTELLNALKRSRQYCVIALVDDNECLAGSHIYGCTIWHSSNLNELMETYSPTTFILAMPSASHWQRSEVLKKLEPLQVQVRSVPAMADLASGKLTVQQTKIVDIADLLGRDAVPPNQELLTRNITGKVVLVTGAGGSIGSEIARQVLALSPRTLILFDHSEFNLYSIDLELRRRAKLEPIVADVRLITVLGSLSDPERLIDTMSLYNVQTIYHAAAYKHVPMVEHNLSQGLRNNVLGTIYTAQAAILCDVEKFVLISTDKAVRPTNVMGASKRLSEMVLQALNEEQAPNIYDDHLFLNLTNLKRLQTSTVENRTCFTSVRFGNVLGSSGSVIPVFQQQIAAGGPITVTHAEINRYFMTIPEAAQLVMQAGAMGRGGDVFVLDMGQPVKITDLARRMITLSGLSVRDAQNPDGDIEITFSGLRPGEKLYEELLIGDNVTGTEHPKICTAREEFLSWTELQKAVDEILTSLHDHNYHTTRDLLLRYVNGYNPSYDVVDWLFQHSVKYSQPQPQGKIMKPIATIGFAGGAKVSGQNSAITKP